MGRSPSRNPLVKNQVVWLETTCPFHVLLCYLCYSVIWRYLTRMWLFPVFHVRMTSTLWDQGKKWCLRGTVLWTELCGSFQMVVVRKWQWRPFFASKNMVISALSKYKIVKRGGWVNLCGQTTAAFIKDKREGNNFGFQIVPVLSCFVLAVLITSSSVQWVLLTFCIWTVPNILALHLAEGILPLNQGTTKKSE